MGKKLDDRMKVLRQDFGLAVKQERKRRKMSQEEFADLVGKTQKQISYIERGLVKIDVPVQILLNLKVDPLIDIAKVLVDSPA